MGEGASRQDHSSLASLSLFHTSEMLQHFTNGIHLLIHTALGQKRQNTERQNTERQKYRNTEIWTKKGGEKKKNGKYSTTDSCGRRTRDWTDRRANELASSWHTVHPVVMGQRSGIRTKTLLEDWLWFPLNFLGSYEDQPFQSFIVFKSSFYEKSKTTFSSRILALLLKCESRHCIVLKLCLCHLVKRLRI